MPSSEIDRAAQSAGTDALTVAALGLRKQAGVTEARIDHPCKALAALPGTRVVWGAGSVTVPPDWPPGIFILHRQFMDSAPFRSAVEAMVAKGWTMVADMDDDPRHWRQFADTGFYAFRAVHAVTVSTEPVAQLIRQWNPHVRVFPNAILQRPEVPPSTPKSGGKLRVFFGAINRKADWLAVGQGIFDAAAAVKELAEFVVVHDREFFNALPEGVAKTFHDMLPLDAYLSVLAGCDIALLPLADTAFNRLKSDLKFIECCAAQVVPVCSPVVYGDCPRHHDIGIFATTPQSWRSAILQLCSTPPEIARRRGLGLAYVMHERMHSQHAPARWAYYRQLILQRPALEAERRARMAQV